MTSVSAAIRLAQIYYMILACSPYKALSHSYGRLGVDHYIRVTPGVEAVTIEFDVHFGEIPTAAMSARLDSDHDGNLTRDEILIYARKATPVYLGRLSAMARSNGREHKLNLGLPAEGLEKSFTGYIAIGENKEKTLRIRWLFRAPWPDELGGKPVALRVDSLSRDQWHSSVIATGVPEPPVRIVSSDVPTDREKPLPPDITKQETDLSKIPTMHTANITCLLKPGNGQEPTNPAPRNESAVDKNDDLGAGQRMGKSESRIKTRVLSLFQPPLSTYSRLLAIALCFVWGAMHAFTPGHGKAVVSAYLVSMRGSYRHAFALGLLVTLTHTAVVIVLAVVALILKDRFVYPRWLAPLGATMILLVGLNQIRIGLARFLRSTHHDHENSHNSDHDHAHDHSHDGHSHSEGHSHWGLFKHSHAVPTPHQSDRPVGTRDIAIVGISGGMVPCPAAIVMLLLAWQLRSPELGLFCLLSFSIGLAATLTVVGILAVSGTRAIIKWLSSDDEAQSHHLVIEAFMPALGGVVLIVCGILMLLALGRA